MLKKLFRWTCFALIAVVGLLAGLLGVIFSGALYNRFVVFPQEARAWEKLAGEWRETPREDAWREFRGSIHAHSEFSHDSEVPFPEILRAAHGANLDFMMMTDHCVAGTMDFSLQWRGIQDGVLFIPGFELSSGFLVWGLPTDAVVPCNLEPDRLARRIAEFGGLLIFTHTEQERPYHLSEVGGMEIYNIHTDILDERYPSLMPDFLLNNRAYPDQTMRIIFDKQEEILAIWDRMNQERPFVGVSANDAHQNVGIRGFYTQDGRLQLRETGPKTIGVYDLNFFTRTLLRLFFGPLEPGKKLFRYDLDNYERSLRYVSTHLLASELTEDALLDALRAGRAFIAFNMLADAAGFNFVAESGGESAVMGEAIPFEAGMRLRAAAPLPCRFRLLRDGEAVHAAEGREFDYAPDRPGNYRVECYVSIRGEWVPWIYANPIRVTP